jgi:cysteine synthase
MPLLSRRGFLGVTGATVAVSGLRPTAAGARAEQPPAPAVARTYGDLVGRTPLYALDQLAPKSARVVAKLELMNPMSVKDRPALAMIRALQASGRLQPGVEVVEASSGNMAIAVASLARRFGFRPRFFMSESVSQERVAILKAYGAEVMLTPASEHTRGARERAMSYCEKAAGRVFLNQHDNEANPQAHYDTTAPEIYGTLGREIAAVVIGLGTAGCFSGISRYMKERNPSIKIIGFEPALSPVYSGGQQGDHHITGIGPGFIAPNFERARKRLDEIVLVRDEDAFEWTRRVAREEGLLVGLTSGAAAKVACDVALRPGMKGGTIVCLFSDTGERYLSVKGLFA